MSDPTYQITLTRKQALTIARALEACFRMGIGQPCEALTYCRGDKPKTSPCDDWETVKQIEAILKPLMGLAPNASWGVGKHADLDHLYEMYKQIDRACSWDMAVEEGVIPSVDSPRKWPEMFGVQYDGPLKYTDQPLIRVERVANEIAKADRTESKANHKTTKIN